MIRSRVGILMQKYDEEKSAEELLKGFNYYHDAIRNDVRDEEGLAFAVLEDEPGMYLTRSLFFILFYL